MQCDKKKCTVGRMEEKGNERKKRWGGWFLVLEKRSVGRSGGGEGERKEKERWEGRKEGTSGLEGTERK